VREPDGEGGIPATHRPRNYTRRFHPACPSFAVGANRLAHVRPWDFGYYVALFSDNSRYFAIAVTEGNIIAKTT
jgi:hypothetical protein